MDHTNTHCNSKVLRECTLPLTGKEVVQGGLTIAECADGVTEQDLRDATLATIIRQPQER
ncbi:hypothetical protein [Microbulbifer sp. S227A]|uniref:hypothetical protein n=1 Tax=Microbulbifer sp. S227A TaxID=3415131 RepID=UPI003C7B34E7